MSSFLLARLFLVVWLVPLFGNPTDADVQKSLARLERQGDEVKQLAQLYRDGVSYHVKKKDFSDADVKGLQGIFHSIKKGRKKLRTADDKRAAQVLLDSLSVNRTEIQKRLSRGRSARVGVEGAVLVDLPAGAGSVRGASSSRHHARNRSGSPRSAHRPTLEESMTAISSVMSDDLTGDGSSYFPGNDIVKSYREVLVRVKANNGSWSQRDIDDIKVVLDLVKDFKQRLKSRDHKMAAQVLEDRLIAKRDEVAKLSVAGRGRTYHAVSPRGGGHGPAMRGTFVSPDLHSTRQQGKKPREKGPCSIL